MAEKKLVRKITKIGAPTVTPSKKVEPAPLVVEPARNASQPASQAERGGQGASVAGGETTATTPAEESDRPSKKVCSFCQKKTSPTYTDLATLKRYMTERAKIVARDRSGVCSKHQRAVAKNIKYARHLSLLPFVPQV